MSANKNDLTSVGDASSNGAQSSQHGKPECFVIMPISDPDGYEPGHFRHVYEDLFIPACDNAGYKAIRADEVQQTNLIHLDVLQKIIESPMALCDLSSRNPNVLFELGLRQAFDKPVVLVQELGTLPIFDINPLRYTSYQREMLYRQVIEDQRKIAEAIRETREAIGNNKSINSIVKLLSLTHGATLTNISEAEKESALLQVIMTEISNLRSEVRASQPRKDSNQGAVKAHRAKVRDVVNLEQEVQHLREAMVKIEVYLSEVRDLRAYSPDLDRWILEAYLRVESAINTARATDLVSTNNYKHLIEIRRRLIEADSLNKSYFHNNKDKEQEQVE
jgi:hypothetical protein